MINKSAFGLYISCLCLIPVLTSPAELKDKGLFELSIEELAQIKVIGSTLTEKTIQDVPASVTVFSRKEIQRLGLDTVEELMNYAPGFQSYRQGENSVHYSYSSRGRKVGTSGREVLILVDGIRMDSSWVGGAVSTMPMIPLVNIERVEFIRGAGSALYGSNAFLGVVNIITVKDANEVQVRTGENWLREGHLLASKKWEEAEVSVFGRYFANDGEDFNVLSTTGSNRLNISDLQKGNDIQINGRWRNTTLQFLHDERLSEEFFQVDRLIDDQNRFKFHYNTLTLGQEIDWSSNISSSFRMGYRHNFTPSSSRLSSTQVFDGDVETEEYWFSIQNDWFFSDNSSLQFGGEYRHPELTKASGTVNNTPVTFAELAQQDIFGLYAQYQHTFFEDTDIIIGGRYDHYSSVGSSFTPRTALIHRLNNQHTLKLLYGEAFRSPAFNELYTLNSGVTSNPLLQPETVKTWEVIWLMSLEDNTFSVSFFDNTFEDSIEQQVVGTTRTFINNNSDESNQGLEFELNSKITEQWSTRATFTYFTDMVSDSFRESEILASMMLNYQRNRWNFNLSANYQGDRERLESGTNARVPLSGFVLLNSKLGYSFNKNTKLFLQIKNLLGDNYDTPAQGALTEGIPNRGREISMSVNWQF